MKLRGHQIIIFGLPRFDGSIESTNYTTAKLLARYNKVYYVENPFTIRDYFKLRKTREFAVRKLHFNPLDSSLIDTSIPNLKIVIPPILLSVNFLPENAIFRNLLRINESIIRNKLKIVIKAHGITDFIFINSFNFHYPKVVSGLFPALTVYHCLDPMVLPFNRRHGVVSEDILVKGSDVVICSSNQLYNEKKKQNPNTYFVGNAADITQSIKALDPELAVLPAIQKIKHPVIGYLGAIERRIDYALLQKVVTMNPDKNFVLVGPVTPEYVPEWFYRAPNVHFLGSIAYENMPAVIKGFDVALIPFKKDDVSSSIFPLKLFEYLGAGKPVVAIDFNPDLKTFTRDAVAYCSTPEQFSGEIQEALIQDNDERRNERVAIASENTWDKRIEEIADIIFKHLSLKGRA